MYCLLPAALFVFCQAPAPSVAAQLQSAAASAITVEAIAAPGEGAGWFPALTAAPDGTVHAIWTARSKKTAELQTARWDGTSWGDPEVIARGSDWFQNWADTPQLSVAADGTRCATWLQYTGKGSYDYGVRFALRAPDAEAWTAPAWMHSHRGTGEHGFVTLLPEGDGFRAVWLDGRNTAAAQASEGDAHGGHGGGGAMALYTAHLQTDGKVVDERALDDRVCDCCATGGAVLPDGGWAVVYRDRDEQEVRDIGVIVAGEKRPGRVAEDRWTIAGCPVNGPVAASSGAQFAVAWFTMGADNIARCQVALRGADSKFAAPLRFDLGASNGRVGMVGLPDGGFLLSWLEDTDSGPQWMTRRLAADGSLGPPSTIAPAPGARSAGFLRLVSSGAGAFAAWTDPKAGELRFAKLRPAAR